jgi:hypothetical protein
VFFNIKMTNVTKCGRATVHAIVHSHAPMSVDDMPGVAERGGVRRNENLYELSSAGRPRLRLVRDRAGGVFGR